MKKLVVLLLSLVVLFSFTPTVCADNIEEAQPAGNFSIFNVDGKRAAYNIPHSRIVDDYSEEDLIKLYYNVYMDTEATDWDIEFWKQRITKEDTTLLTYGMINSKTFEAKLDRLGLEYSEYFIEDGVFYEGFSPISTECGLTPYGDYVFYATFGDSTYYHVVKGADVSKA